LYLGSVGSLPLRALPEQDRTAAGICFAAFRYWISQPFNKII
jgi:hypothetical protein